jgi:hypothetical protein
LILGIDKIGTRIREQYDKVIAFVVLLLLFSSLVYLGVKVGLIRQMQEDFDLWLKSCRPHNPHADVVASDVYDARKHDLENPFQIAHVNWTNIAMFVPETRFNCRECRLPVRIDAKSCPHCDTEVAIKVTEVNPDTDNDGMPTVWEQKYDLDPYDPSDAEKDNDNDGATNLEEYKEGFDPTDPESRPAAAEKLELERITGKRFGLMFNSRVRTRSGYKFGLNYRLPSGETKTDFAEIGDVVSGFTVAKHEEKKVKVQEPFPHTADLSELTLTAKDGSSIILVKGKARTHIELTAHLKLTTPDGSVQRKAVMEDDVFELDGGQHRVIAIDAAKRLVVLRIESSEKEIVLQQVSESAAITN